MTEADLQRCADQVRRLAACIAAQGPHCGSDKPLPDLIGEAEARSEAAAGEMRRRLTDLFPSVGWAGEAAAFPSGDAWVYDPIDGAYHYLQGLPLWSSSLVLLRAGRPVLAVVHDPTRAETFLAASGRATTVNGAPARVSPKQDLSAAVVGTAIPPRAQVGDAEQDEALQLLGAAARHVFAVRPLAAASLQLAFVAAGRLDGYWETGEDAADWLAGSLLVREAGGVVTGLAEQAFGGGGGSGVLAGNAALHRALLGVLAPRAQEGH